jgi:ATP synthase protein I
VFRIVCLQAVVTLVVAVAAAAAWGFGGSGLNAGLSVALGGAACTVPSGLFAWRLSLSARRGRQASFLTFFAGEVMKLALTVALLFVIALKYHEVNWLALLIGFIAALKSYLLALFWKPKLGQK